MHKPVLFAAAAVLTLSSGVAIAGSHPTIMGTQGKARHSAHSPTDRSLTVLYDQSGGEDSGNSFVSQNFETALDADDSQAADDFTVPEGSVWKIKEVDVTGEYFGAALNPGPADSENVIFYKDKNGKPGKIAAEFDAVAGVDHGAGSFVITLPEKVRLKPGTYWLSVQANMDFDPKGEWGWENEVATMGATAVWRNPGNGFGAGCKKYKPETGCVGSTQGDHMFTLKGND